MPVDSNPILTESTRRSLRRSLNSLCTDVAAAGVQLLGPSGQLLVEARARSKFDTTTFLPLLARAMAGLGQAAFLLHDENAFDVHIHEDARYHLYTARITDRIFLCIILESHRGSRIGVVWRYLRRAVKEIRALVTVDRLADQAEPAVHAVDSNELAPPETLPPATLSSAAIAAPRPDEPPPNAAAGEQVLSFEQAIALGLIDPKQFGSQ